jgi:MFS family permease
MGEQQRIARRRQLFGVLYALTGAAGLVYEVTWSRLLTLQMGHSVAAGTVLAAFMGGLAGGAWIAGKISISAPKRLRAYAVLEISIALMALALPIALHLFVPLLRWAYSNGDAPFEFALIRLVMTFLLLAIPAAAMGATFPVVAAWFAGLASGSRPGIPGKPAADVGLLYAANTAGAALGATIAGFWAIPAIGFSGATWLGVILNVAAALGALWLTRNGERDIMPSAGEGTKGSAHGRPKRSPGAPSRPPERCLHSRLANISQMSRGGSILAAFSDVDVRVPEAPFELLSLYAGGPAEIERYAASAPIQTDDRLALKFTAPLGIYSPATQTNMTALRALTAEAHLPDAVTFVIGNATGNSWTVRGQMALRANSYQMAYDSFQRAVALDSHNVRRFAAHRRQPPAPKD